MKSRKRSFRRRLYSRARRTWRRPKPTVSLAVVGGLMPLAARAIDGYKGNGLYGVGDAILSGLTGFSSFDKKWHADIMAGNLGPIVAGVVVHKVAGRLGVNRMLAKAGIPFVRI